MPKKKGERVRIHLPQNPTHQVKAQPQKRGAKGHYTGTRLTFLTSYCDEYIALRGKSRNDFWFRLFTEWWGRYPWRLPDDQEPPTGNSKKMEELGLVGADETLKGMVEEESRTVCFIQVSMFGMIDAILAENQILV